jgi:hypothetical protein
VWEARSGCPVSFIRDAELFDDNAAAGIGL